LLDGNAQWKRGCECEHYRRHDHTDDEENWIYGRAAAAIEAVASTGGQLMPPIMGTGAFIMAEMLGIPYRSICFSAIIPAIVYYLRFLCWSILWQTQRYPKKMKKPI
jgi:hypothetical protein